MKGTIDYLNEMLGKSELLSTSETIIEKKDTYTEIFYPGKKQFLFSDVTKILPNIHILYKAESEDKNREKWIIFGYPSVNNMFIIYLNSDLFGVTDQITAEIYESIENFYKRLHTELRKEQGNMVRTEQISLKELIAIFF